MRHASQAAVLVLALTLGATLGRAAPPVPSSKAPHATGDARALTLAGAVLERMGGAEAWSRTRYVSWRFFGRTLHYWDRFTGNCRIESDDRIVLMNVNDGTGRVWKAGTELTDPALLAEALDEGRQQWVNDSYWMFMPYKLLDPGVRLGHAGAKPMADGRLADVLDVTFDPGVGYTPQNRYEVFVARDTGLVEQWSFYAQAEDADPRFVLPWQGWTRFGNILLATGHGQGEDWKIAVHDDLPAGAFTDPAPVAR